jgi:hypothetical protein
MLHVYTRHLVKCAHFGDVHWRRCHCPKWIRGVLLNGTKIRRSTQSGNWEAAEKLARELETEIDPEREKIEARREFTLREAVETFLGDQKARGLGKETQKKYRGFLEQQFLVWAERGLHPWHPHASGGHNSEPALEKSFQQGNRP